MKFLCLYTTKQAVLIFLTPLVLFTMPVGSTIAQPKNDSPSDRVIASDASQELDASPSYEKEDLDENAVRKLTQIRHRLISVAQASANRVRSTAWLDSDGVLRENTTIKSDAKIRGMQVKSYIKPPAGFSVNQCHFTDLPYKRTGTVELAIYPTDGRHGTYFLSDIAFEASRSFLENNRFRKDWTLNSIKKFKSNYEKAMATTSSVEGTYRFQLSIEAEEANSPTNYTRDRVSILHLVDNNYATPNRKISPRPINITLTVTERRSGAIIWNNSHTLFYPEVKATITTQPLPRQLVADIKKTISQWVGQINMRVSCEPFYYDILENKGDFFTINAGRQSGISEGEHMLIANRSTIPSRILEKGSLEQTMLVVVESVTQDRAELRKIAGPKADIINNKAAMPL